MTLLLLSFVRRFSPLILLVCPLFIYLSCQDPSDPPNEDDPEDNPSTMLQEHIPWPSLADTPWPMYRHDPQGTGRSQYVGPQLGEVVFTFNDTFFFKGSVSLGDNGNLYLTSSDHGRSSYLYAISEYGEILWKKLLWEYDSGAWGNFFSPTISTSNTMYVSSSKGKKVHAFDLDGEKIWTYAVDEDVLAYISLDRNGNLYFTTSSKRLYSLTPNGELRWELSVPGGFFVYSSGVFSPDGSVLYLGGRDSLYAITPEGNILWGYWTSYWILRSLVDNESNIYFYSRGDSCLTSLDPAGEVNWRTHESTINARWIIDYVAPTIDNDGNLYFVGTFPEGDQLFSLSGLDGSLRWKQAIPGDGSLTELVSDAVSNVFVGHGSTIYCISSDGEILWQIETPSSAKHLDLCPAIGKDGRCYFPISHNPHVQVVGVE